MLNDPLSVHRYYSHLPTFYTKESSPIVGNLYERDYDGRTVTAAGVHAAVLQEAAKVMQYDNIKWTEPELRSSRSDTTLTQGLKYFWFEIFLI